RGRPVVGWSLALVAAEALAGGLLAQPEAAPIAGLLAHPFAGGRLPAIGLLAFSVALGLAGLRLTLRPQALECGMFWALLAALLAFCAGATASAPIALAGAGRVLLGSLLDDALPHLETLRQSIESTGFGLRGPASVRRRDRASRAARPIHRVSVSVSIGAAEAGRRDAPAHEVLDAADVALYRAKRTGRNRVCT